MNFYKRLRHTYGFGVHSPFAYRMVKDVVRPGRGYAWYGYEDIDAGVNSSNASLKIERQAKMFHRLISFLAPQSLFLPHGIAPLFHTAAAAADSRMRIERKPKNATECEMIATHETFIPLERLKAHLLTPGHSLVFMNMPSGWADTLFEALPAGLMLHSPQNAILIHRPEMMKVAYAILL
ncbi:MAG: hypothetical protein K2K81_07845 [Muribaculaceae bacterium]|nr:hypothetical protein [Muribaculaceae bacterium]